MSFRSKQDPHSSQCCCWACSFGKKTIAVISKFLVALLPIKAPLGHHLHIRILQCQCMCCCPKALSIHATMSQTGHQANLQLPATTSSRIEGHEAASSPRPRVATQRMSVEILPKSSYHKQCSNMNITISQSLCMLNCLSSDLHGSRFHSAKAQGGYAATFCEIPSPSCWGCYTLFPAAQEEA